MQRDEFSMCMKIDQMKLVPQGVFVWEWEWSDLVLDSDDESEKDESEKDESSLDENRNPYYILIQILSSNHLLHHQPLVYTISDACNYFQVYWNYKPS